MTEAPEDLAARVEALETALRRISVIYPGWSSERLAYIKKIAITALETPPAVAVHAIGQNANGKTANEQGKPDAQSTEKAW